MKNHVLLLSAALACLSACGVGQKDKKPPSKVDCPADANGECNDLKAQIQSDRERRNLALADLQWGDSVHHSINLNQKIETLDAIQQNKDLAYRMEIAAAYDRMRGIFNRLTAFDVTKLEYASLTCPAESQHECARLSKELSLMQNRLNTHLASLSPLQSIAHRLEILHRNDLFVSAAKVPSAYKDQKTRVDGDYKKLWQILRDLTPFDEQSSEVLTDCAFETSSECSDLEEEIVVLRQRRDEAIATSDKKLAQELSLRINFRQEYLDLLRAGHSRDSKEVKALVQKYDALSQLALARGANHYTERELQAVEQVFKDFGPLYIAPSEVGADGQLIAEEVKIPGEMPWSGFWYPKRSDEIFAGEAAPLAKLDRLAEKLGTPISSVAWEENLFSSADAEWAGLCDAWALASVQTQEPKQTLAFEGTHFEISDLKALLVKKFEGSRPFVYGNRYFGNHETDGEIQDLRPEAFHRLVQVVVGERGQPIVVDDDPGPEVWSKPFFRMRWNVQQDPEIPNAYVVRAWPMLVKSRNDVSNELTKPQDMKAPVYEYRLYVDHDQIQDGKYRVIYGEWIGVSLSEHPDMVFIPNPDPSAISPTNPEVAKALPIIDRIFAEGQPVQ